MTAVEPRFPPRTPAHSGVVARRTARFLDARIRAADPTRKLTESERLAQMPIEARRQFAANSLAHVRRALVRSEHATAARLVTALIERTRLTKLLPEIADDADVPENVRSHLRGAVNLLRSIEREPRERALIKSMGNDAVRAMPRSTT
jgi:hypothetical protein